LSPEQRETALAKAAEARRARAELKEKLKMGTMSLREILDQADKSDTIGKMKVLAVLESLPGIGKVRARRAMEDIGIADTRRLRGLSVQARRALLESFDPGGTLGRRNEEVGNRRDPRLTNPMDHRYRSTDGAGAASIFLSTDDLDCAEEFEIAFKELLASCGIELTPEGPPDIGSWRRRYRTKRNDESPSEADRRLDKLEHALEVALLRRPMSETNANQADAIAKLAAAADKNDDFVAIVEGVLLVKVTTQDSRTQTFAKTLTVAEIRAFERNPHLACDPIATLSFLRDLGERLTLTEPTAEPDLPST
jgi:hypothetical protein